MHFYLYSFIAFLSTGCVISKNIIFNYNSGPDSVVSKSSIVLPTEGNRSSLVCFQDFIVEHDLHLIINRSLEYSPFWQNQLANLEIIKDRARMELAGELPELKGSIGWKVGKEKSRETNLTSQKVPDFQSSANFSWEMDLWGKWKALRESEVTTVLAESHTIRAVQLQFVYEIATTWLKLSFLEEEIELVNDQIRQHHEIHVLHLHKFHAGLEDNSSIIEMEIALKRLVSEYSQLKNDQEIERIKIKTLMGSHTANIESIGQLTKKSIPDLPIIQDASFLKNRPDVLASQNHLLAQIKRHQGSILNLYPSLGLNLSSIGMSGDLSSPFQQWKVQGGPTIDIPLWNPKRKLKIKEEKAKLKALEFRWESILLQAAEEIEAARLTQLLHLDNFNTLEDIENQYSDLYEISEEKFARGLISKIKLLSSKVNWTVQKRQALHARYKLWISFLSIGKSLGIGWGENV